MSVVLKFQDFNKVCRLCLNSEELQPIFQEKYRKLISSLTDIEIQAGDSFPDHICKDCGKQLENILQFVEICKSTNIVLTEIISNVKHQAQVKLEEHFIGEFSISNDSNNSGRGSTSALYKEDEDSDTNLNNQVSCPNCSVNCLDRKKLHEHFDENVNCRPKDHKLSPLTLSSENIKDLLDIVSEEKIKPEIVCHEQEFVGGKVLKGKRKFLCNYCGKNYTRKNGLDRHIMSHTGIKPFECKECGKCYITKDTLKTHILIHSGIKPYKCKICQKSFIQSSHLNYHMRRHAGEKPHICSFCGKGFLSTYHLERHKLMHTGIKPFKCDLCDKQFVRSTTLRDHLLLHTGERPFQCQHCGKQFNRKQTLTNHVNLIHIEEENKVINNKFTDDNFIEGNIHNIEYT